jgi:glycine cleavage system aminomethyltransferase T
MLNESLEGRLRQYSSPAVMLQNAPAATYAMPMATQYTNWRDEQEAWKTSAVLFDQSHHMTDVYFTGPDVKRLFSDVGVNTMGKFGRGKAKQFVACNYDGYVISDAILFGFDDDRYSLVGTPVAPNWVAYHAETGGYDVEVRRDERTVENGGRRLTFRYQLNGPATHSILEKARGGPIEYIKFFNLGEFEIAGCTVRALNHTMAGVPGRDMTGLELIGPAENGGQVLDAILTAGSEFGLRQGGALSYTSTPYESGWIPSPLPAIYTGDRMKPYREWLGSNTFEAHASVGGSFRSADVRDYYSRPWDLGYGNLVKFDHDFIGREALDRAADEPRRRKVWLRWNDEDVLEVMGRGLFVGGGATMPIDLPNANYLHFQFDKLLRDGRFVGLSTFTGYTVNIGSMCSLAMVDEPDAVDGAEVTLVWGQDDGGPAKPNLPPHTQADIRATISTTPLV